MSHETDIQESGEGRGSETRSGLSFRAWLVSIVAAIVLSAAVTLLLGGSFRLPGAPNATAGARAAGVGGPCCPAHGDGGKSSNLAAGED